jgi:type I restriction enzyme R subunit
MSHIHHECELERHIIEQLADSGWLVGKSSGYDVARALYPEDVLDWLNDTHPQQMGALRKMHGESTRVVLFDRLDAQFQNKLGGTINVLRNGFAISGAGVLGMSQALPEDARNDTVIARYTANRLRVVPQLRYSQDKTDEIDLVFFINGLH